MVQNFLVVNKWLSDQLRFSRYSHIPIGNVEPDFVTQASDIFFARTLLAKDHVLWASSSGKPDLGGKEQDDNMYFPLPLPLPLYLPFCLPFFVFAFFFFQFKINK